MEKKTKFVDKCIKDKEEIKTEKKIINELRVFVCEMVEKAKSGHPGGPLGIAPVLHVLFSRVLNITASAPKWRNRDIFVLSNGHCCAILYLELCLLGFLPLEEMKKFRQIGSQTPGHPEFSKCIEGTTGPLGQGISQSVGYAIALKSMRQRFNTEDCEVFSNRVVCLVGDGCMQEGIGYEALSLAGHLQLNNLLVIYDYNKVTIDGSLDLSSAEDPKARMEACGYEVREIEDGEDTCAIEALLQAPSARPVFVIVHTTIGKGSLKEGSEKTHGAPLGQEDIEHMKQAYGIQEPFYLSKDTQEAYAKRAKDTERRYTEWLSAMKEYQSKYPEKHAALIEDSSTQGIEEIEEIESLLEHPEVQKPKSTREHLHWALSQIGAHKNTRLSARLIGGSADLSPSNLTLWEGARVFSKDTYNGQYIHFGIREHAMCGVLNGIAAYGWHRPFGSTFLNFVTYAFPAIRISALSSFPTVMFATHDSIALGEDGPTHQPVETLALLRATPNVTVLRPADGVETLFSVCHALFRQRGPSVVALTRQKLDAIEGTSYKKCLKGGYAVSEYETSECTPRIMIVATGSEVSLALKVKDKLKQSQRNVKVVSMLSFELFDKQPREYREDVLSSDVSFSIEALSTFGWSKYAMHSLGLDQFGESGPGPEVYSKLGFTVENICTQIESVLSSTTAHS
ncbi:transketolase [Nematocida sp. AWRm77]|nr:transketolase [Nematocida sp. AWRm77]